MARKARPWALCGAIVLTFLLFPARAEAQPEYPGKVKSSLDMQCTPGCGLCHIDPNGGGPRNDWGNARGVLAPLPTFAAALAMQMPPDFDGDGMDDTKELKVGRNPGIPGATSICLPEYGFSCSLPGSSTSGPLEPLVTALSSGAALLLLRRRRRARTTLRRA